jgi:hypothetical protein
MRALEMRALVNDLVVCMLRWTGTARSRTCSSRSCICSAAYHAFTFPALSPPLLGGAMLEQPWISDVCICISFVLVRVGSFLQGESQLVASRCNCALEA